MKPSVGRIVHYVSYGTPGGEYTSQCRAAIITGVPALTDDDAQDFAEGLPPRDRVDLVVLNPTGLFFNRCPHDIGGTSDTSGAPTVRSYAGGTWHWPEREEA